jgi:hypothetical protein
LITISAPNTDFQVSNNNSTWGASTTISYNAATLTSTLVYVRFTPQSIGPKSGNLTITGGGITTPVTVAVAGNGVAALVPGITASALTSFGSVCLNSVAGPNSFTITGTNLTTGDITVGPLNGFTFSSTLLGTYTSSLTITHATSAVSQIVYVKFTPVAAVSYNGNISVIGGGVTTATNVAAVGSGQAIATPTFTQVAPVCSGQSFTLPTTSNNSVVGTWSPSINNTTTTLYTFTPNVNQCAVSTTMTVVVNNRVIPTFSQIAPICSGETLALPIESINGITGTWSPVTNNTATTTYTFTPAAGQCASNASMTVVVNPSSINSLTKDSTSILANSVVLHGAINGVTCSSVIEYGIEYSSYNGFANGTGTAVPSNNFNNTDSTYSSFVGGLIQNTAYYYRAYTKHTGGVAYGEQKLFFTLPIPAGLTVYSTPILRGANVHYTLSGIKPGHYAVRIFNSVGQLVFQKDMIVQVDFIDDNFILPAKLPVGLYTLQVFNPTFKIQKSMMVQ